MINMLSKGAKNCGMRDKRWTIRDKIRQYRGILKLHGREKKLRAIDGGRVRKRTSRELKILSGEVKEYRGILNEIENGDKRRMHTLFQGHKDFQLAHENHNPGTVADAVDQENCLKRRQLDKLYYVKRKKMKEFFDHKCRYKANKKETLEQIEYQKKRKADCEGKRRAKGEVLINLRSALLNMLSLLEVVSGKAGGGIGKKSTKDHDRKTKEKAKRNDDKESEDERSMRSLKPDAPRVETVDTDALSLLSRVTTKIITLQGMSCPDLDEETERNARILYQNYVAGVHSKRKFSNEDVEPTGIVVEHEVIDASVLTREDIKNRSQQIVEANTRYD
ncbi:uncharacterized protein [Fopius arisanus]|uniref:Uncharacterized protein n=1 Tax=Fopius arisanus TaxID=64838 RepID=A0A9R1UAI8_9HYME|nr:PREDICTED: uncharacterized protein LOC105273541 [Fopius arisanus]